jgi:hypothetical protein
MADTTAPSGATDAVLKPSDPVPEGAREVQGIDFNKYAVHPITVEELVAGMATTGFQASAVGNAVRIINDMVSCFPVSWCQFPIIHLHNVSESTTSLALRDSYTRRRRILSITYILLFTLF